MVRWITRVTGLIILLLLMALVIGPEWPNLPPVHSLIRQTDHVPQVKVDIERLYVP